MRVYQFRHIRAERQCSGALLMGGPHARGDERLTVVFIATLAVHLGLGIAGYREVMNRPWPEVAPLDDEDDW